MFTVKKAILASSLLAITTAASASYEIKTGEDSKLIFGGYIKADTRYTDGNIGAVDYWYGGGSKLAEDQSNFGISVNETRFNTKYVHGDVTGFIEMDFYGDAVSGGGNEVISNSSNPRLRHAFIKYKNILVGQTWTTFQNTSSLAEAADFGGPLVASAFIRQGQVRYTNGGLQLSIENPESYGGYRGAGKRDDSVPDFIGKYTFKGDWGNVSVSALGRQLKTVTNESKSAFGYGVAGRINTVGKDDLRFQFHGGNVGRYIGVVASTDIEGEEVEDTTSIMVAYRHFWTDDIRSSVFYGNTQTDETDRDRTHWGVNVFKSYTKALSFGLEFGNFEMAEQDADSNYLQLSAKYAL